MEAQTVRQRTADRSTAQVRFCDSSHDGASFLPNLLRPPAKLFHEIVGLNIEFQQPLGIRSWGISVLGYQALPTKRSHNGRKAAPNKALYQKATPGPI